MPMNSKNEQELDATLHRGSKDFYSLPLVHIVLSAIDVLVLFVLSYIVPKSKDILVFGNGQSAFKGNPKYLFLFLKQHSAYKCYYFSRKRKVLKQFCANGYDAVDARSFRAKFLLLRAAFIFVDGSWGDVSRDQFVGRFPVVNLWHGDPIKCIGYADKHSVLHKKTLAWRIVRKVFDFQTSHTLFFVTKCYYLRDKMQQAFRTKRVEVLGYPANDVFFDKNIDVASLRTSFGGSAKKVFLYVPTFREANARFQPFSDSFLEDLNAWLGQENFCFLIKAHPMERFFTVNDYSHVKNITGKVEDVQELLCMSDVLISDYSGALLDFTLQERPVIIYNFDQEDYVRKSRELFVDIEQDLPGPFCRNETELLSAMQSIDHIFHAAPYREKYAKYNNQFNTYKDGHAAKRVCRHLGLNICEMER